MEFASGPPLERLLRQKLRHLRPPQAAPEPQAVEAVESLLFKHRYDDGSTVLTTGLLGRRRSLDDQDRALISSWHEVVDGIVEVLDVSQASSSR